MTDRAALLAAADGFVPEIKARAGEFERLRRIPPDLAQRLAAARLYALLVPRAYGGVESDPLTMVELI